MAMSLGVEGLAGGVERLFPEVSQFAWREAENGSLYYTRKGGKNNCQEIAFSRVDSRSSSGLAATGEGGGHIYYPENSNNW